MVQHEGVRGPRELHVWKPGAEYAAHELVANPGSFAVSRLPGARADAPEIPGGSVQCDEHARVGDARRQFQQRQLRPGSIGIKQPATIATGVEIAILTGKLVVTRRIVRGP